jgi:hypothetical protein
MKRQNISSLSKKRSFAMVLLLRVDVYPSSTSAPSSFSQVGGATQFGTQHEATGTNATTTTTTTLYTSLSTNDDTDPAAAGRLLTVGRKTGQVTFPQDQSVSRLHASVRLVLSESQHEHFEQLQKDHSDRPILPPLVARTPAEIEACSKYGWCLVVETLGKAGCTIIHVDQNRDAAVNDVGQLPAAIQRLIGPASRAVCCQTVAATASAEPQHVVLNPDWFQLSSSSSRLVILVCGKAGSCVVLRRQPLCYIASGISNTRNDWPTPWQFYCLGVTAATSLHDTNITHLVTPQREATPKQLVAWCRGWTVVAPAYWDYLWQRSANDDLHADQYPPRPDFNNFWTERQPRADLWATLTYLSVTRDDFEALIQTADATIVKLYNDQQQDKMPAIKQRLDDWRQAHPTCPCFALLLPPSKSKSSAVQMFQDCNIPLITPKRIGECITQQVLPVELSVVRVDPAPDKVSRASPSESTLPTSTLRDAESVTVPAMDPEEPSTSWTSSQRIKPTVPTEPSSIRSKASNRSNRSESPAHHDDSDFQIPPPAIQNKALESTAFDDEHDLPNRQPPIVDDCLQVKPDKQLLSALDDTPKLPLANASGWFTCAPANSTKRQKLARSREEIAALTGNEVLDAATTQTQALHLLVTPDTPVPRALTGRAVVNYSKFRKNLVAQPSALPTGSSWQLGTAGATATWQPPPAVAREYEKQERELQEQLRRAEELFR